MEKGRNREREREEGEGGARGAGKEGGGGAKKNHSGRALLSCLGLEEETNSYRRANEPDEAVLPRRWASPAGLDGAGMRAESRQCPSAIKAMNLRHWRCPSVASP